MKQRSYNKSEGSLMISVLIIMGVLTIIVSSLAMLAASNLNRSSSRIYVLQSQYSAESGIDITISKLNNGLSTAYGYSSTAGQLGSEVEIVRNGSTFRSTYQTMMADGADGNQKIITAVGRVYVPSSSTQPTYTRTIRIAAQRNSSTVSSSVVSRNIIHLASSVKTVWAKDLFVNKYIKIDKNTTDLIAENITVAGNDASGAKCSLAGRGNLIKPSTFSNAGQTKTVLNLAYNNCISPPGNVSNANFTVFANKTDITPIQSTYIPWSYKMPSNSNAMNGCTDWTSLRTIPSVVNVGSPAKTHYPDSSSGVATSCGTNGTVNLGSSTVTISSDAHLRANLCSPTNACAPTFNNPSGHIVFVFVEGTLSFSAVKTATGSSPIVFVVYGADPAALSGVCPLGGAAFLDKTNSDKVIAPALYLIAVNGGFCADGTKFGATKSLGGVSGKNIYIATNSGTPFDLSFDPSFPVNDIPVNLSWQATTYERL